MKIDNDTQLRDRMNVVLATLNEISISTDTLPPSIISITAESAISMIEYMDLKIKELESNAGILPR